MHADMPAGLAAIADDSDRLRATYRQRNELAAVLASAFESVIATNDPQLPGLPVLYVHTPHGQLSWHLHPDDVDTVAAVSRSPFVADDDPRARWDGHNDGRKASRLAAIAEQWHHDADVVSSRSKAGPSDVR